MLSLQAYGRIASDIKIKNGRDNKHVYATFLLASHHNHQTTFIRCVAFDGTANLLHEYFSCGDRIILRGELISDDYNNTKYVFKFKISEFEFVETLDNHNKNKTKNNTK